MKQTGTMSLLGLAAKLAGAMSVEELFSLPQSFSRVADVPVGIDRVDDSRYVPVQSSDRKSVV